MGRKNKVGKSLTQTKDQTPLLPLSGTRKVVRTPTNPFETVDTVEVFVAKKIIARRIQHIFAGSNKGRKADHYLVVWEGYPLKKDYTWEPIENLYGHEDLAQTYEQWLKTENERLDSQEAERKTKMTGKKKSRMLQGISSGKMISSPRRPRGRTTLQDKHCTRKSNKMRRKLQPTETTMVVMTR